ncbi:MAG: hypothetical protein ACYDEY_16190 [Acidimicrobiales bacterium]
MGDLHGRRALAEEAGEEVEHLGEEPLVEHGERPVVTVTGSGRKLSVGSFLVIGGHRARLIACRGRGPSSSPHVATWLI